MPPEYPYPTYRIALPEGLIGRCIDLAPRLLHEAGFAVNNERFLDRLRGKAGIRIDGGRVFFEPALVGETIDRFIETKRKEAATENPETVATPVQEWRVTTAGFSMMTIDLETEELREATCADLRSYIKLANSFGVGGSYMVMPQDLPPVLQALACFKICFEMSETIRPYDYQQPEQLPFLYEMHHVVGRPMDLCITIPTTLTVDPKDLDIFLDYYDAWKRNRDIRFRILNYPMTAITKPVTIPGCLTMCFCETLAVHILLHLLDPELDLDISLEGGQPTDLRNACWAFGSPRKHLYRYLNTRIVPNLLRRPVGRYACPPVLLETASAAVDEQAALEKMATGLLAALQGCREFGYAGVLCVDDVYSGAQFVIDLEIVDYIRETVEAFNPHPDILNTEGLYEECLTVARGEDLFISHPHTVDRYRNIIPSSKLLVREKLRSWMQHRRGLKDRARAIARERIRAFQPFALAEDQQRALDRIYANARSALAPGEAVRLSPS